jgi:hypothetical protein
MALLENSRSRISEDRASLLQNGAGCGRWSDFSGGWQDKQLEPGAQTHQARASNCARGQRPETVTGWALIVLLIVFVFCAPRARSETFKEYELKAAFLYNFAQFVEWPPEAFPTPETPLVIGVLGVDPFGRSLDALVNNEVVKNRRLVVQRYRRPEEIGLCHILFISSSEAERFEQILAILKGKPILTVGDSSSFAFHGGVIRLLTDKNKIRLRINMAAAKAANLIISSKLLRAADIVSNDELGRRL